MPGQASCAIMQHSLQALKLAKGHSELSNLCASAHLQIGMVDRSVWPNRSEGVLWGVGV